MTFGETAGPRTTPCYHAATRGITFTLRTLTVDGSIGPEGTTTGAVIGAIATTLVEAGLAWVPGRRALAVLVRGVPGAVSIVGFVFVLS